MRMKNYRFSYAPAHNHLSHAGNEGQLPHVAASYKQGLQRWAKTWFFFSEQFTRNPKNEIWSPGGKEAKIEGDELGGSLTICEQKEELIYEQSF